jgi:hypothetical protein
VWNCFFNILGKKMKPIPIEIACACGIWRHPRVEQCKEELFDCPKCKGLGYYRISTAEQIKEEIYGKDSA